MWAMMTFTARRAKIVITVSEHTKQDMIRFLRMNPEKIEVIPEGVETRFHGTYPEGKVKSVLDTYGIKQPFLLCVGEQRPHKNITSMIMSFSSFIAISGKKHHLVISGTPYAGYNEPEAITRELGLADLVHFVYISDPDLPIFYQAADAYLNLSLYEGFGLPILEAMASGTPVIASNRSSLPEIVGSAGILVNPKDIEEAALAMEKITSPGDFRDRLISTGRERAKMFTWENCAQRTLNVYLEAAK
jgi:glycosyltransferase involved in cell wall biosynthesis